MTPMTDTEREARADKRRELKRAERVKLVFTEIDLATKGKSRVKTDVIAAKTGLSEQLVLSTIHLVNRTMAPEYDKQAAGRMLDYAPDRPGEPGGWRVSKSWEDRAQWHLTLHRHAVTRCESLAEEADVAEGLWPGGAPNGLSAAYRVAIFALDQAGGLIDKLKGVSGKAPVPQRASRGVKLRG